MSADTLDFIVANPTTPHAVIAIIATHPHTAPDTVAALASRDDAVIREAAGNNRNTPVETLTALAHDSSEHVRYAVARNPNTPAGTLRHLAEDQNTDIATAAIEHRTRALAAHAEHYPPHQRDYARMLLENGFPGWDRELDIITSADITHTTIHSPDNNNTARKNTPDSFQR